MPNTRRDPHSGLGQGEACREWSDGRSERRGAERTPAPRRALPSAFVRGSGASAPADAVDGSAAVRRSSRPHAHAGSPDADARRNADSRRTHADTRRNADSGRTDARSHGPRDAADRIARPHAVDDRRDHDLAGHGPRGRSLTREGGRGKCNGGRCGCREKKRFHDVSMRSDCAPRQGARRSGAGPTGHVASAMSEIRPAGSFDGPPAARRDLPCTHETASCPHFGAPKAQMRTDADRKKCRFAITVAPAGIGVVVPRRAVPPEATASPTGGGTEPDRPA